MSVDIVGLGRPVMDFVINTSRIPEGDGAVRANEMFNQGGGKVSTGMVASARLGAKAGIIARVGGDFTGDFVLRDFAYNGVDTSRVLRGGAGTSGGYCISLSQEELGTRVFIGRNARKPVDPLTAEELDYDYIAGAKFLHIEGGEEAPAAAAGFARERGVTVSIDADHYTEAIEALLPKIDLFIGSEFYYQARFRSRGLRDSLREIHRCGPSVAWFTLGSEGAVGLVDGEFYEIPIFPVAVRDTTGAGDVFHGAYLAARLEGLPHPECARFASAVSAIKCTYVGGRTGIPTRRILERFLKDGVIETDELDERLEHYRNSVLA